MRHPREMGSAEVNATLTHLAREAHTNGILGTKVTVCHNGVGLAMDISATLTLAESKFRTTGTPSSRSEHDSEIGAERCLVSWICNPAGCRSLHHCFATHLLERRQDIGAIEELIGLNEPRTRMIHKRLLNRRPMGVANPAELLQKDGKELLVIPGPYKIPTISLQSPSPVAP